jgi:hypothetical protein
MAAPDLIVIIGAVTVHMEKTRLGTPLAGI